MTEKLADRPDPAFELAWLRHQHRHDHHWQWWILREDNGGSHCLPMLPAARTEMLCDWIGAGRAQGAGLVGDWWAENKHKMQLHQDTKRWIENEIEDSGWQQ